MSPKVYIGGKLYEKADAKISVFDHGLLYGDGIFEGIRSYAGNVFRLKAHVDRLYDSAKAIHLAIPMSREAMARAVVDTLAANKLTDAYIRLIVTRGAGSLGLDPRKTTDPQIIIITDSISLYPPELYEHGLKIVTAGTMRNHPAALNPRVKSLNYLNSILAKIEGTNAGCLEALMLNHKGEVAECTGDNIFIVKRRRAAHPLGRRRHPRRDHPRRRDRAGPVRRDQGRRARHGPPRRLHRRRDLPDRDRRRGHPRRRVRRPPHRHRQARPDHQRPPRNASTSWSASRMKEAGMIRFEDYHRTIVGYYGTRLSVALDIVNRRKDFEFNTNEGDRLGHGVYFWEYAPQTSTLVGKPVEDRGRQKDVGRGEGSRIVDPGTSRSQSSVR